MLVQRTCTTYKNDDTGTSYRYGSGRDTCRKRKSDAQPGTAEDRRWWALAAVSLATFMTYLDNNVVNVAIPTIQRSLHLSVSGLEWVVSSYLLMLAGLLLVGGRLADVYGRRRLFLIGLAVFTLSSLAAGLAGSGARPDRQPGGPGPRRRAADAGHAGDHHGDLHQRPGAQQRRSASGPRSARWPWRSAR